MPEQIELFKPCDFVDLSLGMSDKSTKRKRRSPSSKSNDRLSNIPNKLIIKDFSNHATS